MRNLIKKISIGAMFKKSEGKRLELQISVPYFYIAIWKIRVSALKNWSDNIIT